MVVVKNLPTNSINLLSNTGGEILYDSTINHPVVNNANGFKKFVLSDLNNDVSIGRNLTVTGPILSIPSGNTAGRPSVPELGYIRYNSETSQFEGYGAGNSWGSLGGVTDVNQNTKILAEDGAGNDDDNIRFFNDGSETMRLTSVGDLGIGSSAPDKKVEINSSTGDCLRLTYNDSNGSASNYVDFLVSNGGNLSITPSGNNLDITTHNGSTQGLKLGGVLLTATATELNNIVSGSGSSSFSTATVTGDLTISNHDGSSTGLILGSTLVTATADELNYLDTTPGTADASKALVLDSSRNITNINNFNATKITTDGSTYSELLTTWTPQTSIANNTWKAVAYSPSLSIYVAIANNSANTSSFASSTDGLTWTTQNAVTARVWNDIIWVEDLSWFVAVADATSSTAYSFAYSSNGTTWTGVNAPANRNFTNIIYNRAARLFLAGSSNSTTEFSYRSNTFTSSWTVSKNSFTYNNGPVLYISQLSKYLTMRNGNTSTTTDTIWFEFGTDWNSWNEFSDRSWGHLPMSTTVKAYKWAANSPELGIIVAVATDTTTGVQSIAYSTNLATWTYGNAASAGSWFKIIWAAELGLFVAISSDSTPKIMKSSNGINWSLVTYSESLTTLSDIKWIPELSSFLLVSSVYGSAYAISSSSMLSTSNITFIQNPQNLNFKSSITGKAFVDSNSGFSGTFRWMNMPSSTRLSNELMRLSTTGLSINSPQSSTAALDIKPVTSNNNKVLRLRSPNGTYAYDFSLDSAGTLTTTHSANTSIIMDHPVKIGNTTFINSSSYSTGQLVVMGGVGIQGRLYTGDTMYPSALNIQDQYLWATLGNAFYTVSELNTTYGISGGSVPAKSINTIAWSPQLKLFVATTGDNGLFLYSSDGLAWNTSSTALNRKFKGVCWADKLGLFVAIAFDNGSHTGVIATSSNGISWAAQNGPGSPGIYWTSIAWSPSLNLLVACAQNGSQTNSIMYSSNGSTWTFATTPATTVSASYFMKIIWNPTLNQFVACGYGQFAVSNNGVNWNLYNTSATTTQFSSVEYSPTLGLYVACNSGGDGGATSTDGITWTKRSIPAFGDIIWVPRIKAFIGSNGPNFVSSDNYSTNGTFWTSLGKSVQNGGYYNGNMCYSPDLEIIVMGRSGASSANMNIVVSKTISYTNLNMGRNYAFARDNRTTITMDSHLNFISGFNGGHRWYNSLVDNQPTGQNLLMALDTEGLAIGRSTPQAKIDIQLPSAGEIIRFRTSEYSTASLGIDSSARITMSHSILTSSYNSSSDYGFIIQNNSNNNTSGLLFKYKNSAGNYFNASGILPYGISNTSGSESTGVRFYNTTAGSYYNSFSIMAAGGCNTKVPSSGTIHSFGIDTAGNGTYGDLSIEGNGGTWLRLRTTYQTSNDLAKFDFINRYHGIDTVSFTLTPTSSNGGNITNVNNITSNSLNIAGHNGSTIGLTLGGTLVTSTATELNYVDTTPGTAEASKALVLDENLDIVGIHNIETDNLTVNGTLVTSSAVELNYVDVTTIGVAQASKALVLDENLDIVGIHNIETDNLTVNGTLVTSSAVELNYVDVATIGVAQASKAIVVDSNRDITNINQLATTGLLSTLIENDNASNINYQTWTNDLATDMVTALQMNNVGLDFGTTSNHPLALITNDVERVTIDTSGNVDLINHDGSTTGLTLGGTLVTSTATELNYVDTTAGAAEASKALVLDSSRNITNINELATTGLLSTLIANDNASNINYQTWTNDLATDMVTALQMNNVGLDFGTTSNHPLALITNDVERVSIDTSGNVDLINHDGSTIGLTLGGTLVTSTATELNYVDTTAGAAEASKALVLDSSRNITNINELSATILNATIDNGIGNSVVHPITINRTTSSTPANGLGCGMEFYIENSNNDSIAYGSIEVSADDITDSSEDGKLKINLITGGISSTALTLTKESLLVEELIETSDRRVKENIVSADIKDSYEKIMALHIVNFNFIHDKDKRIHRGVIAQEVNEIIPGAVHVNKNEHLNDFHSISTKELVGYMIGSLQHMNNKYLELEEKYNELQKKYNELQN